MQIFNNYFEATLSDIKHLIDRKDNYPLFEWNGGLAISNSTHW